MNASAPVAGTSLESVTKFPVTTVEKLRGGSGAAVHGVVDTVMTFDGAVIPASFTARTPIAHVPLGTFPIAKDVAVSNVCATIDLRPPALPRHIASQTAASAAHPT